MNQFVPDWSGNNNMGDAFAPLGGKDDGLIELLWCNGQVVMQNQAVRKPPRPDKSSLAAAMQEDEAAPWFQYPVDDSLEKDLFSEIFGEMPAAVDASKACKEECGAGATVTALQSGLMPPPRPAHVPRENVGDDMRGASEVVVAWTDSEGAAATEAGESSMVTIGSSICGSNHVQTPCAARARVVSGTGGDGAPPPLGHGKAIAARPHHDATPVTSTSMRSRLCSAKTEPPGAADRGGGKRKQRETIEPGSPSEGVEFESAAVTCEPAQKLTTAKRRRAAEVHNLSERRRRDRINEKMKALQELIPHCNKTDKASMLDEAIEYLKSLQLQVQMMWIGSGMAAAAAAPVMFPVGVHQYMQRMGIGMGSMTRIPPFMASPAALSSPVSQMHRVAAADPYAAARCLAVEHLQPPSPMRYLQGMNFYQLGAVRNLQQNPAAAAAAAVSGGSLPAATARELPPDQILHKKYGVQVLSTQ